MMPFCFLWLQDADSRVRLCTNYEEGLEFSGPVNSECHVGGHNSVDGSSSSTGRAARARSAVPEALCQI